MKQKPAFILNVITPPGTYDVNISPDKREVVLTNEDYIIDSLKSTIDSEYESSRYTFTVNSQADSCTQSQLLSTIFAVPRPAPSHVPPFISSSPTTANSDRLRINDASSAHLLEVEDDGLRPMIDQMDAAESEDFECGAEILSPDELLDGNCHVGSEVQSSREDTVVLIQQKQNKNITYARDALQHKTLRFDPFLVMQPDKRSPNNVIPSNMPLGRSSIDPEDEVIHSIVPQGSTDIVVSEDSDEKGRLHNKFLISILGSNSPEKISYKTSPKLHVGSPKKRSRCLEEEMPQISSWSFDPASVLQSSKRKRDRVDSRVDAIFRMPESEKKASDKVLTRCEGLSAREGEAGIRVLSKEARNINSYFSTTSYMLRCCRILSLCA